MATECNSALLADLVTPGRGFPDMDAALSELEGATDWAEARSAGRVVPREVLLAPDLGRGHVQY